MEDSMANLRRLCVLFRVLGLGTSVQKEPAPNPSAIRLFCNRIDAEFILKLGVVLGDFTFLLIYGHCIYSYMDLIGAVNDLLKYVATVSATILILVESQRKGDKLWHLNDLAMNFQQKMLIFMRRKELATNNRKFWRSYGIKFISFSIFFMASDALMLPIYLRRAKYSLLLLIGTNIFITICRYRHLQHIMYMTLVHYQLELLVKVLSDGRVVMTGPKLQRLHELYMIAEEMVRLQNEYFGLSQAMNLIFNHLQLLGDAYWTYWRILNGAPSYGSISKEGERSGCGRWSSVNNHFILLGINFGVIHTAWLFLLVCHSSIKSTSLLPYLSYWLHRLDRNNGVTSVAVSRRRMLSQVIIIHILESRYKTSPWRFCTTTLNTLRTASSPLITSLLFR